MDILGLAVGPVGANCYLCWSPETAEAVIIDPGAEAQRIMNLISEHKLHIKTIILTHFHFDHVMAAVAVRTATQAPIAIHRFDAALLAKPAELFQTFTEQRLPGIQPDILLEDGKKINFGSQSLTVIFTPGHSPGGICLYSEQSGELFSGDTLFRHGIGRTDFPGSDSNLLYNSIRTRLFTLPEATVVHPGHGPGATIGEEKRSNPFVH